MLLPVNMCQLAHIQGICRPINREKVDSTAVRRRHHPYTGTEHITVFLADLRPADICQHRQQLAVILTVLAGQIADCRMQRIPAQCLSDKAFRIFSRSRITLALPHKNFIFGSRTGPVFSSAYRRQLVQIPGKDYLYAAKWLINAPDCPADFIDHIQQPRMQHGDLINDQDICLSDGSAPSGPDPFKDFRGQHSIYPYTAPGMDRLPVDMGRCDTC